MGAASAKLFLRHQTEASGSPAITRVERTGSRSCKSQAPTDPNRKAPDTYSTMRRGSSVLWNSAQSRMKSAPPTPPATIDGTRSAFAAVPAAGATSASSAAAMTRPAAACTTGLRTYNGAILRASTAQTRNAASMARL